MCNLFFHGFVVMIAYTCVANKNSFNAWRVKINWCYLRIFPTIVSHNCYFVCVYLTLLVVLYVRYDDIQCLSMKRVWTEQTDISAASWVMASSRFTFTSICQGSHWCCRVYAHCRDGLSSVESEHLWTWPKSSDGNSFDTSYSCDLFSYLLLKTACNDTEFLFSIPAACLENNWQFIKFSDFHAYVT